MKEMVFIIKGLDCPNCARELENKFNKVEGVKEASINFFAQKLFVTAEESSIEALTQLANDFEDGVTLKRIK